MRSLSALAFVCACMLGVARADVRDARVISARAGGVNLVTGDVKVRRAASAEWLALSTSDELKSGDTVRTGPDGRVEVLLNPGSYFRAGGGTEFTLASADVEDLRVDLTRGSAVVEATGYGDMRIWLEVKMRGAVVTIVRSGVYRLNAPEGGPAEVAVTKGRALVGGTVVKGGNVARVSGGGAVEVAKLDKKWRDELDLWSRERGRELAKANEKLTRNALMAAFNDRSFDDIFGRSWGSYGFWFYNSSARCYTFLPLVYGWRSPYGHGYDTGVRPSYPNGGWTPGYSNPGDGRGTGSNPGAGTWSGRNSGAGSWGDRGVDRSGGSGSAGSGSSNSGGGRDFHPANPPMSPPPRIESTEGFGRVKSAEPVSPTRDQ